MKSRWGLLRHGLLDTAAALASHTAWTDHGSLSALNGFSRTVPWSAFRVAQIQSAQKRFKSQNRTFYFHQVSFAYPGREHSLTDIQLTAKGGQTTAIVGLTGSGKSTLIRLLLVLMIRNLVRSELENSPFSPFSWIHCGPTLAWCLSLFYFDGTVRENLRYGKPSATTEELIQATQAAEAYGFIEALPNGFDTLIGERGQKLSGGQRQRLSLARAILKDPPILILDEATSAVDNETEAAIQRSLSVISQNRTTIVIAHRLSTIRTAHQILVLDQGRLVEQGRHEDD